MKNTLRIIGKPHYELLEKDNPISGERQISNISFKQLPLILCFVGLPADYDACISAVYFCGALSKKTLGKPVENVDHGTILNHLKAIGEAKKLDKWVPPDLNEKQKLIR